MSSSTEPPGFSDRAPHRHKHLPEATPPGTRFHEVPTLLRPQSGVKSEPARPGHPDHAKVPALSPFPETSPPVRRPVTHSTPAGPALGCSPPAPGGASCLTASPEATLSSQELVSHPAGVSPATTASRRRLSTIRASGQSSALSVPGEEPRTSAPEPQQQQGVPQARSGLGTTGLPGIPDPAPRKRRDPQARAAAMERVRQWEIRLLLDIEEAVQHELTIQEE
ncbi:coiled-coil domain-containing protein 201 [Lepus europaeus]|uniref:coiled-coil domain-containing protein 201 n=1 Tax=Lepus europaeus TaxID=9983 RepID=UPI002B48CD91|nr:coiled-coil domain-containing protein 201 [Lepus europaeus]